MAYTDDTNCFFGKLPAGLDQQGVTAIFSSYGTVVSVKVFPADGRDWTAGLVRFATAEEAKYVVDNLNNNIPQGCASPIEVRFANPSGKGKGKAPAPAAQFGASPMAPTFQTSGGGNDNIFFAKLPMGLDEQGVTSIFSQYGTVTSVKVFPADGRGWTAGLARFATCEEAKYVVDNLNNNIPQGCTEPIEVRFANQKGGGKGGSDAGAAFTPNFGGGAVGAAGAGGEMDTLIQTLENSDKMPGGGKIIAKENLTEVFVFGLTDDTNELHLYKLMAPFGQIAPKGVTIMRTRDGTNMCRGFGFVNFLSLESANWAVQSLNGTQFGRNRVLKVEIKNATAA